MIDEDNYIKAVEVGLDYLSAFENDNNDYLEHHGVEGMKWGIENGPPYPLSGQGKKDFIAQRKAVREEKKKKKILNDPKKLAKNASKFTKEEIDEANAKFESLKKTKQLAKPEVKRLSKQKMKMSKDPMTLEKHAHKFSKEELDLAISYLDSQEKLWNKKLNTIKRPQQTAAVVNDYLGTTVSFVKNIFSGAQTIIGLRDLKTKVSLKGDEYKGLTTEDAYEVFKKTRSSNAARAVFNKKLTDKQVGDYLDNLSDRQLEELFKKYKD